MRTVRRHRTEEPDRGAALVEFALIMPLLFLLLFGIIEFGVAFNDYQAIRQGAREGARQAVVSDYGSDTSCGINGPAGSAPNNAKSIICLTKDRTGIGDTLRVGLRVVDNAPTGSYRNDSIKVCTVRLVDSITGFFGPVVDGRALKTNVVMRAEKDIALAAGDYLETDPSGAGWSWC